MIFADPPDAIGTKYDGFRDTIADYRGFLSDIVWRGAGRCDIFWLSINAKHSFAIGAVVDHFLEMNPHWEAKHCVQTFTFGQHQHSDLCSSHRPLIRLMRRGTALYPEAIRIQSWRQANGDKRADPRGRVPGDVFDFPRVTGNNRQRRDFCPTQLHEGLYERCVRLSCQPGDTVVDLFAGSGTLGRVAERCGINAIMVEISRATCDAILIDQKNAVEIGVTCQDSRRSLLPEAI
jgi:hypothetical protein